MKRGDARTLTACAGVLALVGFTACERGPAPVAPVLTPTQALATFRLAPGYSIELVAAEPLVHDPVAVDFDADGRMYVVEMSGFMPNVSGTGEQVPDGKIVVLEDTDHNGTMDRRTVFLDSLVLPRTVAVLEHGVLVGAPPFLWLVRDTTGDLRADSRVVVRGDYGSTDANPEHNANGALWGLDNWLHSANDTRELRLRADGTFESRAIPSLGQWGVSSDEYGRLYRNSNEDPLRTDLVPAHYGAREGAASPGRGVYAALTANVPVFPSHKTPAVNRGYREKTLRADSTLAHYTSAGSPTAYVGDRYPVAMRHSVFVTESAGNLVGQFTVADSSGAPITARRAQDSTDFLTSTDERFRPVSLANAPDGTLYVVDMYRGIIQHRTYITDYLEEKIRERGLETPPGHGRIYRIVYDSTGRGAPPRLSAMSSTQLVATLAHANGWWRMTAQRLLVERRDTLAAPAVHALLRHTDARVRLHALWTLDGLGMLDAATVMSALADASPHVRAAAVRLAEPWIARDDATIRAAAVALAQDSAVLVRRQLAASLVVFPEARRLAVASMMLRDGVSDIVVADLMAHAAGPRALTLLTPVIARAAAGNRDDSAVVEALAAQVARSADGAHTTAALAWTGEGARRRSLQVALLSGLTRGATGLRTPVELATRPASLLALTRSNDTALAAAARRLEARLHWAGKPAPAVTARTLTEAETARIAVGRDEFGKICAACHQANGAGLPGVAASLVGSAYVNGAPSRLIRIVLQGKDGTMLMPPIGATMSDERIASILSFIRREWGNRADPIDAAAVKEVRGATTGRHRAWTVEELANVR
ncbi:MAG: c-type cytochrome [Gemmatimonadaceae bacterium]|nr:c-type cytochrome [Gemmatimonadaceae bacterium]